MAINGDGVGKVASYALLGIIGFLATQIYLDNKEIKERIYRIEARLMLLDNTELKQRVSKLENRVLLLERK